MKRSIEVRKEAGVIVVGVPQSERRIEDLSRKSGRSQAETLELILLRQERIEGELDSIAFKQR